MINKDTNLIQTIQQMIDKFHLNETNGLIMVTFIYKDGVMRATFDAFDGSPGYEFAKVWWMDRKNPKAKVSTGVPFEHILWMEQEQIHLD
jgi:hypothetical protein